MVAKEVSADSEDVDAVRGGSLPIDENVENEPKLDPNGARIA